MVAPWRHSPLPCRKNLEPETKKAADFCGLNEKRITSSRHAAALRRAEKPANRDAFHGMKLVHVVFGIVFG
jgi:hypothetical protein